MWLPILRSAHIFISGGEGGNLHELFRVIAGYLAFWGGVIEAFPATRRRKEDRDFRFLTPLRCVRNDKCGCRLRSE